MSNNDRLQYINEYFKKQEKVKVEVPVQISETIKGRVIHRYNGSRCGYSFKDGIAWVDPKDLHLFRVNFPYMIIHDRKEEEA